jgi:hypothetical protein
MVDDLEDWTARGIGEVNVPNLLNLLGMLSLPDKAGSRVEMTAAYVKQPPQNTVRNYCKLP